MPFVLNEEEGRVGRVLTRFHSDISSDTFNVGDQLFFDRHDPDDNTWLFRVLDADGEDEMCWMKVDEFDEFCAWNEDTVPAVDETLPQWLQ